MYRWRPIMRVGMRIDMCIGVCIDMCIGMCMEMCIRVCMYTDIIYTARNRLFAHARRVCMWHVHMFLCMPTCVYTCMRTQGPCAHIDAYVYAREFLCACACVCVGMGTRACAHASARAPACMHCTLQVDATRGGSVGPSHGYLR